jgi:diguanylate cyclase (GGDEF)-like protein
LRSKKEKKEIFLFLPRKKPFTDWSKFLKNDFKLKHFYKSKDLLSSLLFSPPQAILYYFNRDRTVFENLLQLKHNFNLVSLAIILVLEEEDLEKLSDDRILSLIDDIILTNSTPLELKIRLSLCLHRLTRISDNNPLTGLPGNVSIELAIKKALESEVPLAIGYVDLDNFKAYNDIYGFSAGDEVIKNLARILQTTIFEKTTNAFLGHIGGDDFVFIVPLSMAEEISKEVIQKFNALLPAFLSEEDLKRGYFIAKDRQGVLREIPLLSVSIALVPITKGKFKHPGEVAARAAQVKSVVKKMSGSNYFMDRRA